MKTPEIIEFHNDCRAILCNSLKTVAPEEGCCILIGTKQECLQISKKNIWVIKEIWPCCNIWGAEASQFTWTVDANKENQDKTLTSKANRFIIDPREQFAAQRWAREQNYQILGSAHSHPQGNSKPSEIDLEWHYYPGLMMILDKTDLIKAWWITNKKDFHQVKLTSTSLE